MPLTNDCQCDNCQYTKVHGGYMPCRQLENPPPNTMNEAFKEFHDACANFIKEVKRVLKIK